MPKKHSTVSLFSPTYNKTLTAASLQALSLSQGASITTEINTYYGSNVRPYYVEKFLGSYSDVVDLIQYDETNGAEIESNLKRMSSGANASNNEIAQTASMTYDIVVCIRHAFSILRTNNALETQISELQAIIDSGAHSKKFHASILCDIKGTLTLDLRYMAYIKEHGPPEGGIFDPEKLAQYVWVDADGVPLADQDYPQYTSLGKINSTQHGQVEPTIFIDPEHGPQYLHDFLYDEVPDNPSTPW